MIKNLISASIVADSINKQGDRITSFELIYPRYIHSEIMTHRSFSRNSASSRAIPFETMVQTINKSMFVPSKLMRDHKGMQGTEYIDEQYLEHKINIWKEAASNAIASAKLLHSNIRRKTDAAGIDTDTEEIEGTSVSKQICNRLLEPFAWYRVLITATDFENFFALRAHEDAEINIQDLAYKMLEAYNASIPKFLNEEEWHLPYGDQIDEERLYKILFGVIFDDKAISYDYVQSTIEKAKLKIAIARCARTSYTTIDTQLKHDYEKDFGLYDKLLSGKHMSPFEHVAQAMTDREYDCHTHTYLNENDEMIIEHGWCGNFKGFKQYRKKITGENQKDSRVIKK